VLVDAPDFSDPHALSKVIEDGIFAFIDDVERFFAAQDSI
jgi:hypothetical protein